MAPSASFLHRATSLKSDSILGNDGSDKHPKIPGQNIISGKSKGKTGKPHASNAVDEVQATSIPVPIPADSASAISTAVRTTLTIPPTFSLASNMASTIQVLAPTVSSHVPLTTTVWIPAPSMPSGTTGELESGSAPTSSPGSSGHLPTYGVILVASGSVALALAAFLMFRCFLRRRRHVERPRPSAPILQESPLFGGKERLSRGIWSDPSFNNLFASHAKPEKGQGWRPLSGGKDIISEKPNKRQSVYAGANLGVVPAPVSPASVYTAAAPATGVGVALEFPVPPQSMKGFTQPLNVKDKVSEGKTVRRRSVATSLYGTTEIGSPMLTDATTAITYHASRPAPTPGNSRPTLKPSGPSRDNTQRPSRKNVPSRNSQGSLYRTPSASRGREKEEPFPYTIPSVKSQERRVRDTKALTSALGLGSPPPPSSCFSPVSIYPDDSLSIAHGRDYTRPPSEAPPSELPSPSATHAALGDLMLQDFPSAATFNSLRSGDPFAGEPAVKKSAKSRINDRPPRVPSPPPLPSLSQMALANADPDYHSPTYSIYGLYEAQRKSKRSSMGK
ncbi:hypothetical protein ACEPAF_4373 [Sanghuangporus sanghuang]